MMGRENANTSVKLKHQTSKILHSAAVRGLFWGWMGFLGVQASILGTLSPFGVALAAGLPGRDAAPAILGAAVGYVLFAPPMYLKYIGALVLLIGFAWEPLTGSVARLAGKLPRPALTAVALLLPSIALILLTGRGIYDVMLSVSESGIAAAAVYFFARTRTVLPMGAENYRSNDIAAVLISLGVLQLTLLPVSFFGFSVGRFLASLTVLLGAVCAGSAGGAIAGIGAGLAVGLLGGESFLMAGFALGGLVAGVFSSVGIVPASVAMALVHLALMFAGNVTSVPVRLSEVLLAGAVIIMIPPQSLSGWKLRSQSQSISCAARQDMLTGRLSEVSGALRSVGVTTKQVNEILSKAKDSISDIYQDTASEICKMCESNCFCWGKRYTDTCDVMNKTVLKLRRQGKLSADDFPDYFSRHCKHTDLLAESLMKHFDNFVREKDAHRKLTAARGVLTEQFEGMALLIDGLGEELSEFLMQDTTTEGKVRRLLESKRVTPLLVRCVINRQGRCRLLFHVKQNDTLRLSKTPLTAALSELCQRTFELPFIKTENHETAFTFTEKTTFTVRWGASQATGGASRHCGDSYGFVDAKWGRLNYILSDGMGSGSAAAVDSAMTADLLAKMLEAGISMEGAMRLVNCALLAKNGQETLATLDMTSIDLYTGQASFYKAGAAPTFLLRRGKGGCIESRSMPMGIVTGVDFVKTVLSLTHGDWIVMVSDGVTATGQNWMIKALEDNPTDDPKTLCELLVREAFRRRTDGHQDDITVLAMHLLAQN